MSFQSTPGLCDLLAPPSCAFISSLDTWLLFFQTVIFLLSFQWAVDSLCRGSFFYLEYYFPWKLHLFLTLFLPSDLCSNVDFFSTHFSFDILKTVRSPSSMELPSLISCLCYSINIMTFYYACIIIDVCIGYLSPSNYKLDGDRDCASFLHYYIHNISNSAWYTRGNL